MRVKLKEDIRIKELSKNHWYGCRSDTMKFIDLFYNSDHEQDVIVATKESDGFYKIITNDGEYAVTPNAFEIIEEDKEIENKPIQELKNKRFTRNQKQIAGKINEVIRAVNELKKGK